jgi:hypothetical protein
LHAGLSGKALRTGSFAKNTLESNGGEFIGDVIYENIK